MVLLAYDDDDFSMQPINHMYISKIELTVTNVTHIYDSLISPRGLSTK